MKIFKKQIPVRHILYVVLGWLHATMLCVPLYALVLNFVSEGMTKDVILQNTLRGFLILAPIALSWFAIKCLRRIFFYILASIGITVLTGFLFDSVLMAVVALFICFMRLYGRLHGESYSLFDHAGYAGLAVFAVPLLCSVFTDRPDLIFQPVSLVFAAVYFVLCLTQRGILQRFMKEEPLETLQSVCTREDILALQKQAKEIYIHPVLLDYMIDLVQATRSWPNIDMGVSPRGSLALVRAVRAYALVRGGAYVVPEDIKTVAVPVLAHRLQLSGSVGSTDAQKKAMTDVLSSVALPTEDWSK